MPRNIEPTHESNIFLEIQTIIFCTSILLDWKFFYFLYSFSIRMQQYAI